MSKKRNMRLNEMSTLKNIALAVLVSMPLASFAAAETTRLEDLSVMALGAVDGRAVVKTTDNKMQVVKVGETIPGTQAVLTQVLNDKLVVEDTLVGDDKKTRKQTAWVFKAPNGDKSRVQRLETEAPKPQVLTTPGNVQQEPAKQTTQPATKKK
jgi:type II secretory pathway component PulC